MTTKPRFKLQESTTPRLRVDGATTDDVVHAVALLESASAMVIRAWSRGSNSGVSEAGLFEASNAIQQALNVLGRIEPAPPCRPRPQRDARVLAATAEV
jgi:hypothetical protein